MKPERTLSNPERELAARLHKRLKKSGRSQVWLAQTTGFSPSYINKVLGGGLPPSSAFVAKFQDAIGEQTVVAERFRGRMVIIPAAIVRRKADEFTPDETESVYRQAWKDGWVKEHGEAFLVLAAERAFILAEKIQRSGSV